MTTLIAVSTVPRSLEPSAPELKPTVEELDAAELCGDFFGQHGPAGGCVFDFDLLGVRHDGDEVGDVGKLVVSNWSCRARTENCDLVCGTILAQQVPSFCT